MQPQNAIALLKQDHQKVKKLLTELAESSERAVKRRTELRRQIASELDAHAKIEEEIFYPAYKDALEKREDQKLYYEAVEEHHAAKLVLADLLKADPASLSFAGKAKVLKELVEHHAEEEESEMFPKCKKAFSSDELKELGERMQARKHQLLNGGSSSPRAQLSPRA